MKRFEVGDYVKVFKFFAKVLEIIFEKVTEAEVIQWRLET